MFHAWTSYLAYAVSFLTIGAAWLAHTSLTDRLTRSDPIFLQINLLVLLVVAFLPFPIRLAADALHDNSAERVAVTIYGLTLLASSPASLPATIAPEPALLVLAQAAPTR